MSSGSPDAGLGQPGGAERLAGEHASDGGPQALELELAQALARQRLDRVAIACSDVALMGFPVRSRLSTSAGLR